MSKYHDICMTALKGVPACSHDNDWRNNNVTVACVVGSHQLQSRCRDLLRQQQGMSTIYSVLTSLMVKITWRGRRYSICLYLMRR